MKSGSRTHLSWKLENSGNQIETLFLTPGKDAIQVNAKQRQLRETVVLKWMSTSSSQLSGLYSGNLGAVHRQLLASTIKDFALCEDEQRIVKSIISQTQICLGTSSSDA